MALRRSGSSCGSRAGRQVQGTRPGQGAALLEAGGCPLSRSPWGWSPTSGLPLPVEGPAGPTAPHGPDRIRQVSLSNVSAMAEQVSVRRCAPAPCLAYTAQPSPAPLSPRGAFYYFFSSRLRRERRRREEAGNSKVTRRPRPCTQRWASGPEGGGAGRRACVRAALGPRAPAEVLREKRPEKR